MVTRHGFVAPCIPTRAVKPPVGPDWVHEIKHDGRLEDRSSRRMRKLVTQMAHLRPGR
jgi:hypothetical protein